MALTSSEIANKEFLVGLRGYDKDEVRAFLQAVAEAFDEQASGGTAAPAAAAPAAGGMSDLGGQIENILNTARDEAAKLRSDAEADAAKTRADADTYAETTRAEAEQHANEARQKLTAAQDEALGLVADAQERVDKMIETSKAEAEAEARKSVAELTDQVGQLTATRDAGRDQLNELRAKIDKALSVAEGTPGS